MHAKNCHPLRIGIENPGLGIANAHLEIVVGSAIRQPNAFGGVVAELPTMFVLCAVSGLENRPRHPNFEDRRLLPMSSRIRGGAERQNAGDPAHPKYRFHHLLPS